MKDVMGAQGIASTKIGVTSLYGAASSLLVKNWTFTGAGTSGDPTFAYKVGVFADGAGAAGQGNANPPGAFFNHFIVLYGGNYYDPSYGNGPYATQDAWEDASLDGFSNVIGGATLVKRNALGAGNIETVFTPL